MWEFAKGNTFGAMAFTSYGAFWISFWWLTAHTVRRRRRRRGQGVGTYLLAWAIFTAYMTVAATKDSGAVLAVFGAADADLPVAGDRRVHHVRGDHQVGGWLGLLTALGLVCIVRAASRFSHGKALVPMAPRWPRANRIGLRASMSRTSPRRKAR